MKSKLWEYNPILCGYLLNNQSRYLDGRADGRFGKWTDGQLRRERKIKGWMVSKTERFGFD